MVPLGGVLHLPHTELTKNGIHKLCRNIIRGVPILQSMHRSISVMRVKEDFHQILFRAAFHLYFGSQKQRWAQSIQLEQATIFPVVDMRGNRGKSIAHDLRDCESMASPFSLAGSTSLALEERL